MAFIHLDGDWRNISSDNLFEVTAQELKMFHKQRNERLSPELTKAYFLKIRLESRLKELEEAK